MSLHVFRANHQPAHSFQLEGHRIRRKKRALVYAKCCKQLRWAQSCTVQAYCDGFYFWCRDGKGCRR